MLFLKKDTFEVGSTSRLVKAADAAALVTVDEVMEHARREGLALGREQAEAYAEQKKLETAESSVAFLEKFENTLVSLVMEALNKCADGIGDERIVSGIVAKVLNEQISNQRQITVRTGVAAAAAARAKVEEIHRLHPMVDFINVVVDDKLGPRSCVIETPVGVLDASMDVQFAEIEKSLRRQFKAEER